MRGVEPAERHPVIHFDTDEAGLLAGIVDQLTEILADARPLDPLPVADDPFAQWEAEFAGGVPRSIEDPDALDDVDPVIRRLFPDAYSQDPAASDDFRRFTQPALAAQKLDEADIVLSDLQATDRRGRCTVSMTHLGAWLKTLNNVRLALAVRLDITDEISADEASQRPEEDPRSWLYEVYAWTGWLQECVLAVI